MKSRIKVTENIEKCEVLIGDQAIPGWIINEEKCPQCNNFQIYHDNYDSEFCAYENKWLSSVCGDETCDYCKNRPSRPLRS